jgi:PAS domain S-box-containing protein
MQLLHLEDSPSDAELIGMLIRREWPHCHIRHVANADEYRAALANGGFDLILSDYTLPGFDGLAALALARSSCPQTPFLFLSGTIGEERAVEALKRGATDYIIKDRPTRLLPAIRQAFALIEEADRRRGMEEALRQNEERFRQITENVAELIMVLDLHGRRVYANPACRALLGERATVLGSDSFEDVHPDDRAKVRSAFERTIQAGESQRFDHRLLLADNSVRQVETHTSVLRDGDGRTASVLVVSHDVTTRREAEARLREQASLLDKARDAIVATDLQHRISYWNASAERLYGWKAADVHGRRLDELGLGFDPTKFAGAREQLIASGEWRGDFRLRTKSADIVLVESTWSLVMENGRPRSILYIDTDVTEKKRLETQLLRAQRMESIGTLAGGVAHDLNNVLTPILLSIELMSAKATSEEDRKILEKTKASASHGAALVQQLLAFARGADGRRTRVDPQRAVMDLQPLIRQSLPADVALSLRPAENLWPIDADATQFNQVLINLCINARDAMPRGGQIDITAENTQVDPALARVNPGVRAGAHVRISVADNGTGIPASIIDHIFDPFFTTKAAGKGTGLGLSMVAGIMKSHGGFVQLESEEGRGTTFHLFFPAKIERNVPTLFEEPRRTTTPQRNAAILLIDDEPVVRDTLQLLLQRDGYQVYAAGDGASGIAEFDRHAAETALVITDMMLPDQIGTKVVEALRTRQPKIPVIAISGMMGSGEFDSLLRLSPPVECLAKPLTPAKLLASVRKALGTAAAH